MHYAHQNFLCGCYPGIWTIFFFVRGPLRWLLEACHDPPCVFPVVMATHLPFCFICVYKCKIDMKFEDVTTGRKCFLVGGGGMEYAPSPLPWVWRGQKNLVKIG